MDTARDEHRTAILAQPRGPDDLSGFSERLLELLPAAVYICDAGGVIVRYNRRAAELWGRRPRPGDTDQRFCGSYRLYRVNGDPLAHAATPMAEVLRTGSAARDQEVVIERPDGTRVVVLVNIDPLHGADGALVGAVNCFKDITARKQAEAEREVLLARTRRHGEQVQALARASLAINASADLDGLLHAITDRAREIVGAHQAAVTMAVGGDWSHAVTAVSLSDKYARYRGFDGQPDGSGIYAEVYRTKRPMRLTQAELEAHPLWRGFGRHAGEHPPLRGWLAAPLIGRDGRSLGLLQVSDRYEGKFTAEDEAVMVQLAQLASVAIENARAEQALRDSEERYRRLVDLSPDALFVSLDSRIVHASRALLRLLGATEQPDRVIGRSPFDFIAPEDRPAALDRLRRLLDAGEPAPPVEQRWRRLDGSPVEVEAAAAPLPWGGGIGVQVVLRDLTERRRAEEALRHQLELMRTITDNAASGLFLMDRRGHPTFINPAVERMTGLTLEEIKDAPLHDALHHTYPDGRPFPMAECPIDRSAETLVPIRNHEDVFIRKDGTFFPVSCNVAPLERDGERVGAVIEVTDITERRRAEERQRLLLAELNHRVKNALAVVQAIAERTGAGATTVAEFIAAFRGRLGALAAAHSLLTQGDWQGVGLAALARAALAPYLGGDDGRFRLALEDVALKPAVALTLASVLHELVTNAAKYGALSASAGRVTLTASGERAPGGGELRVTWEEAGGPAVRRPEKTGFGTAMIAQAIGYQHDGMVELDWRPEGLVCRLALPLAEATGAGDGQA